VPHAYKARRAWDTTDHEMNITLLRNGESYLFEIDDKHAESEFGGIPLSMIERIKLKPDLSNGVQATQPTPKELEHSVRKRGKALRATPESGSLV
jgi:hypothetical protein